MDNSDDNKEDSRDKRIAELTSANTILKANISTLYRTARAEISRKDKRISDLEMELSETKSAFDDLIFRRRRNVQEQSPSGNLQATK